MPTTQAVGAKPGTITLVSCNLDLITDPIPLRCRKVEGAHPMPVGAISGDNAICFKAAQWASGASRSNTAKWRNIHGGGWCSPRNLKFKGG
jgi:hypothetical protein